MSTSKTSFIYFMFKSWLLFSFLFVLKQELNRSQKDCRSKWTTMQRSLNIQVCILISVYGLFVRSVYLVFAVLRFFEYFVNTVFADCLKHASTHIPYASYFIRNKQITLIMLLMLSVRKCARARSPRRRTIWCCSEWRSGGTRDRYALFVNDFSCAWAVLLL